MNTGPELETGRLRLRPSRAGDAGSVHALLTDERVREFLLDGRTISAEDARAYVAGSVENFARHGYGLWLAFAREDGNLVGLAGLLPAEAGPPNLIYAVGPGFWGRGYATEAAGAVLGYAFEGLSLAKVRADVDEPNVASVRVLEKLGMRRVGRAAPEGRPLLYFERDA